LLSDEGREKIQNWGRRGRSFSIFQCSEDDAAQIAEILDKGIPDLTTVYPSDLLDLPEPSGPVLLYNITSEEAYKNANALHRLVVRLIRWENQPFFLLSPDHLEEWEKGNLWLGDGKIDRDGLRLDALTHVLKQDSVIIPSTSSLDLASDQPEMTYIEQQMAKALDEKELCFRAQALIGRYHVDFLVEKNGAQVVVECDGKAYHSSDKAKEKDGERDLYLQGCGYPVLRFTGGEINSRIGLCVEQIQQALDELQVERSQSFRMDDKLDDSQKKAVFTSPGQVCVLAPAGSGKTLVLTNRGIHLVNEGFHEHRVLAMAFNKKAREEMQERLRKMGFLEVEHQVHTFNSYGAQLLDGIYPLKGKGFAAYEDSRYCDVFFSVLEKRCGKWQRKTNFNKYSIEAIRKTKGQLTAPGKFLQSMCQRFIVEECPKEDDPIWSEIFEEFLEWQKGSNHLTFADQVYLAVRELAEDPIWRRHTQMSLDALLIDEFQDLDAAQSMLIEILVLGHGNLFVVGDDDQMIYGWRGADIERLRGFLKDPRTRKIVLSTNYRSSQLVVRHAGFLISHNTDREVKNVRSKEGQERGKVELFIGEDIGQERNFLVRALNSAKEEGFQWKDLAVLVRYKELYQPVIGALERANIPFACEAKGKIYSRRAARALTDFFAAVLEFPVPQKDVWGHVLKVSDIYPRNEYLREVSQATDPISFLRSGRNTRDATQRKSIAKLLSNLRALSEKQKSENLNTYDLFQAIDTTFRLTNHFKQELGASDDNDAADDGLVIDLLQEESKDFSDPRKFLKYCKDE
jgi:superfamily I DNA/RNA helicase/very-short-patch-repair endonuclease